MAGRKGKCKENELHVHNERGILITATSQGEHEGRKITSKEAEYIRYAIDIISSHHGNVIITFPDASYKEVSL